MDNFLKLKNFILDLFFPKFCLGCNREGSLLCDDCRHTLDICQYNYCLCENHPQTLPPKSFLGKCSQCQNKILDGLYFALPYQEKNLTKKIIHQFKYQPYLKSLAPVLASILTEHFVKTQKNTNEIWQDAFLVPVPMHAKKIRERGYNQSEELAKELAKIVKVPIISNILVKTKPTAPQMTLKKEDRQKNLLNAFEIASPSARNDGSFSSLRGIRQMAETKQSIAGKKIFLIDDVYTTGSTMQECAKVLKQAGAKSVWGIAIARDG